MRDDFNTTCPTTQPPVLSQCPHCHAPLVVEALQPGAPLFAPALHALVDHLLVVQEQLNDIKRLVEGMA